MAGDWLVLGGAVTFVSLLVVAIGVLIVRQQRATGAGIARLDAWARARGLVRQPVSTILGDQWRGSVEGHAVRVRSGDVLQANESAPSVETVVEVRGAGHRRALVLGPYASRMQRDATEGLTPLAVDTFTETTRCSAWSTGPTPSWLDPDAARALAALPTLVQAGTWDDLSEIRLGERTPDEGTIEAALRLALAMARARDDRGPS